LDNTESFKEKKIDRIRRSIIPKKRRVFIGSSLPIKKEKS